MDRSIKLNHILLSFTALMLVSGLWAQNDPKVHLEAYDAFFEQGRESIFLDLPKKYFYPSEPVPFAGYILENKSQRPSLATTNVYTALYDSIGSLVDQGLYYAQGGTFRGQLKIPDSLASGVYYIKAYTNWTKNFGPQYQFVTDIRLLDSSAVIQPQPLKQQRQLRFYPEGGQLVAGVENSVGFYFEAGVEEEERIVSCGLLDQWGNPVLEGINVNSHGYGKFLITPSSSTSYILEVKTQDGASIKGKLPEAVDRGIGLKVSSIPENHIAIGLEVGKQDLESVRLVFHRDGLLKVLEFDIREASPNFRIPKEQVLAGLNKLSVFDQDRQLLAERIFFNDQGIDQWKPQAVLGSATRESDSISLRISLKDMPEDDVARLSLAVLPIETKARGVHNIRSWFGLQKYFDRITSQDPTMALNDRAPLYDLDLFLLGNEWNRYDWSAIESGPPAANSAFETGIQLEGLVRGDTKAKGQTLIAYQKSAGEYMTSTIGDDYRFRFEEVYLAAQEPIQFFLEGDDLSPNARIDLSYDPQFDSRPLPYSQKRVWQNTNRLSQLQRESDNAPEFPGATVLDEVFISAKAKPQLTRNEKLTAGVYEGVKISPDDIAKSIRLSNYLRKLGFQIRLYPQFGKLGVFAKSSQDYPPVVYVNGFRTTNYIDDFMLDTVDEIYYEHFGLEGSDGGTLYIYQNYGRQEDKDNFLQKIAQVGFSTRQFEADFKLTPFARETFLDYGLVHWEDQIVLPAGQEHQLRFYGYGLQDFKVYINGITDQGGLIYHSSDMLVD